METYIGIIAALLALVAFTCMLSHLYKSMFDNKQGNADSQDDYRDIGKKMVQTAFRRKA